MPNQPSKPVKIAGVVIRRPTPPAEAAPLAPAPQREPIHLAVEVQNPNNSPLYVWASRRAYDYDPATHVLTLYLTEHTPPLPPGIVLISNHPRMPDLVQVQANGSTTLDLSVPPVIRRLVPGTGLGTSFVEEPIDQIDRVELHIQSSTQPLEDLGQVSPEEHRERLLTHGQVTQKTIKPTKTKEH